MSRTRIEVWFRAGVFDARAHHLARDIADLGIRGVTGVREGSVYLLEGAVSARERALIAKELLTDPVTQASRAGRRKPPAATTALEVRLRPGVTDTVGETALRGIRDLGLTGVRSVAAARRYFFSGPGANRETVSEIARRLLASEVIHAWSCEEAGTAPFNPGSERKGPRDGPSPPR